MLIHEAMLISCKICFRAKGFTRVNPECKIDLNGKLMVFIGSHRLKEKRHILIAIDVEKLFNTT